MARRPRLGILLALLASAPLASATTTLTQFQELKLSGLDTLRGVAVSPDGAHVYVTSTENDGLAVLGRDAGTGLLTLVEIERDGEGGLDHFEGPLGVTLSPDGAYVYVAVREDDALAVFARDAGTGALTHVQTFLSPGGVPDLRGAWSVAVSPDGENVYVGTDGSRGLIVFSRDALTGEVAFLEEFEDDVGGADALARVRSLAVSPDGLHVYTAARNEDAVGAWSRDALAGGTLTFLAKYEDGVGGVALRNPESITLSPDGAHVYVGGSRDPEIAVFERDAGTGLLTFVEGEPGSVRVNPVLVSPDGSRVVALRNSSTDQNRDSLALYDRDAGTGEVAFVSEETFRQALGLAQSPDGVHLYAGAGNGTVGAFRTITVDCTAAAKVGCFTTAPLASTLTLKRDAFDAKSNKVTWKWSRGPVVGLGDFGDPIAADDHLAFCLYDGSGATQPLIEAIAPARGVCRSQPCWKASTDKLKYRDSQVLPDGLRSLDLKAGSVPGVSLVKAKLKGALPDLFVVPALPLTLPVTVQVQAANGNCWEATYSTPARNDTERFTAKSD